MRDRVGRPDPEQMLKSRISRHDLPVGQSLRLLDRPWFRRSERSGQTLPPSDCATGAISTGAPSPMIRESSSGKLRGGGKRLRAGAITASIFSPSGGRIPIDIVMIPAW